uniref:Putative secreted protein n=1 Tax=Anopheles triannulatus TaxID=58253 RepID=A0A2M4B1T8_9DIPT
MVAAVAAMTIVTATIPPAAGTTIDPVEEEVGAEVPGPTLAVAAGTASDCRKPTTSLRSETGWTNRTTAVVVLEGVPAAGVIWTMGRIGTIVRTTSANRFQCPRATPAASWINLVAISSWEEEEATVAAVAVTDNRCPTGSIMAAIEHKARPGLSYFTVNIDCVFRLDSQARARNGCNRCNTIIDPFEPPDETFLY